ncbi:hypothetical protein BKA58DRAFT_201538 [Alternaria rosae]|uniref:uncharacterized protein n=1 Tax=Alternaria rosae TaxID=1187941 RepID=UPI001E8CF6AC|nr:uncharacterized protein BKA58DRAFT_201538 [Alternaria rosae]KAH6868829.1 hypothetical protein BKA58DRAFT_201538 [Alternaria rosae]
MIYRAGVGRGTHPTLTSYAGAMSRFKNCRSCLIFLAGIIGAASGRGVPARVRLLMLESSAVVMRLAGLAFLLTYGICNFSMQWGWLLGHGVGLRVGEPWCGFVLRLCRCEEDVFCRVRKARQHCEKAAARSCVMIMIRCIKM